MQFPRKSAAKSRSRQPTFPDAAITPTQAKEVAQAPRVDKSIKPKYLIIQSLENAGNPLHKPDKVFN